MKQMLVAALFTTSIVLLSSPFAQSQTGNGAAPASPRAKAGATAIPRLADGTPDMQGYWTNQTFTPLERLAQFKGKEFFTAEEAEAFARRALDDVKDVPRGDQVKRDAA